MPATTIEAVPTKATYLRNCLKELKKTAVNPIVRFTQARIAILFCRPKTGTRTNPAANAPPAAPKVFKAHRFPRLLPSLLKLLEHILITTGKAIPIKNVGTSKIRKDWTNLIIINFHHSKLLKKEYKLVEKLSILTSIKIESIPKSPIETSMAPNIKNRFFFSTNLAAKKLPKAKPNRKVARIMVKA